MGASGGTCMWPFLRCWLHSEHLQVCYSVSSGTLQMILFCSWQPFLLMQIRGVLLVQSPVVYLFKVWQSRHNYTCKKSLDLHCGMCTLTPKGGGQRALHYSHNNFMQGDHIFLKSEGLYLKPTCLVCLNVCRPPVHIDAVLLCGSITFSLPVGWLTLSAPFQLSCTGGKTDCGYHVILAIFCNRKRVCCILCEWFGDHKERFIRILDLILLVDDFWLQPWEG